MQGAMSWSELERLVDEAEAQPSLRRSLKGCRSTPELILAARRLGYRITRMDLQRAWEEERQEYQREATVQLAQETRGMQLAPAW